MTGHLMLRYLASCALLLTACEPKAPADESAAAVAAIRAADAAWSQAFSARDTTAAVAAVESTGSVAAPNAPIATGSQAIRALFEGFYALPAMTIHWEPAAVEAARSGELGYSRGAYQLTYNDAKGKPVTDQGKYVSVWRKQADGTWKVVVDEFNSDQPLPATP